MNERRRVVIGMLGTTLDAGVTVKRWSKWRPTVAIFQDEALLVDRLELIYQKKFTAMAEGVMRDIRAVSPETEVRGHLVEVDDPWDFEAVFEALHGFARNYAFDPESEDYLVHITTGTHVAQICMFLLTESGHFPGRLLQASPPRRREHGPGDHTIIDLDLSKYDRLATRFVQERREGVSFLKGGIETRNLQFNKTIDRIERVVIASKAPLLLTGPTGAGKTHLARRIYELKRQRRQVTGAFVEVNCATLRGDMAMSTLFGHRKGAFSGAVNDRPGLLMAADGGLLFLDEIGELGLDEQAMLLRALESKRFLPVGSDEEVASDFQLIAGTNRDLLERVDEGEFREDLMARINLWTFALPGLKDRMEDIEPNLHYELDQYTNLTGSRVTFNKEARERFLRFATSSQARWRGNFRDLNAAVTRMATLAEGGRITVEVAREEMDRLSASWRSGGRANEGTKHLEAILGKEAVADLDRFDRVQLADVLLVCREAPSLSEAGRRLFAFSRTQKKSVNDADRIRKYLARFGLSWQDVKA